ncbi:MAG: MOSC domain-containing protein [Candidatus Limnocylindrales bacterium]
MHESPAATVLAVHVSPGHTFSKPSAEVIRLVEGIGVEGDAHAGRTVQHLSRVRRDATAPNQRQVHLMHAELFDELADAGYAVRPGDLGENVTTHGIDLLALPTGTRLRLGSDAVVELTGLRTPCSQLDAFQSGLMKATLGRAEDGSLIRKTGVMAVVVRAGEIRPGDQIDVTAPAGPAEALQPV